MAGAGPGSRRIWGGTGGSYWWQWGRAGRAGHSDICGHVPAGQVGSTGSVVLEEKNQVTTDVWGGQVGPSRTAV